MEKPSEEQIRQRAYELWEQSDRPQGREHEFWQQAERELHGTPERAVAAKGSADKI